MKQTLWLNITKINLLLAKKDKDGFMLVLLIKD